MNIVLLYFPIANIRIFGDQKQESIVKIPKLEKVTPIYFVPGMAADISIFEYIDLPKENYSMHFIPWIIPEKQETLSSYAKKMCREIRHTPCVLIGVSFGGIMVQEMARYIDVKKVIIISSVKSKHELPGRMRIVRKTKMYRFFPTSILSKIENWEKLAFGDFAKKRAALYQKYLSVSDKIYLDWAIEQIVCWDQEKPMSNLIHIHGDKDIVFPIANIKDCLILKGGTHAMIINRARWFNEHLPKIIKS